MIDREREERHLEEAGDALVTNFLGRGVLVAGLVGVGAGERQQQHRRELAYVDRAWWIGLE